MAMAEVLEGDIFEEREDIMVPPEGGIPTLRTAHFLKPTSDLASGPTLKVPSLSLSCETKWALKVAFNGWRDPLRNWKLWVDRMHDLYHPVWKEVGVYEAIMGSNFLIRRNDDLIFGLAERWCSETNTFLFPWGEATITLEDVMILGGLPVLGGPVFMPLNIKELVNIQENLENSQKKLVKTKKAALHSEWLKHFMDSGHEFEHEAFIALWLSRFVFPGNVYDTISTHLFPIAIHLARGFRIAFGPSFLASIYRDLSLLKETMAASMELEADDCKGSYLALTLWAPLRIVQVWAWERLPPLQPKPNGINSGEPRVARWRGLRNTNDVNVSYVIRSAGESFLWRPYVVPEKNWLFPKFYNKENLVYARLGLDEAIESFARCMRVCELTGIDCLEPYYPNRVAMQFGMDQDLPGWIPRSKQTREIAWNIYNRPICDVNIYIPSRMFESDVTARYLGWWKESVLAPSDMIKNVYRKKRSPRRSKRLLEILKGTKRGNEEIESTVKPEGKNLQSEASLETPKISAENGNDSKPGSSNEDLVSNHNEHESSSLITVELPELDIEARISRLERIVAAIKARRSERR